MRRFASVVMVLVAVAGGCTHAGRVVDGATGRPLPGVDVQVRNRTFEVDRAVTDDKGRFDVFAPVHATVFTFSKPGYSDMYLSRREFFGILPRGFRMQRR